MKTIIRLLFIVCFTPSVLTGQKQPCKDCECILKRARETTDFEDAIKQFNSARNNCPNRAAAIDAEIIGVFQKINQLKVKAEKAEKDAKAAQVKAQKALETAKIAEQKAKESENKAIAEQANTQKALEAAKIAEQKAKEAEAKALAEQLKTQKALDDAKAANERVVKSYLRDIEQHILKLEYEAAAEKCQTALALDVENQKAAIAQYVFEVAYWFTETDTAQAAVNILKLLNINVLPNRNDLRKAIESNAPPQYFASLEERYYPKMIDVEGGTFKLDSAYNVDISSFRLARTETTVWQYFLFVKATQHKKPYTPTWQWSGNNPIVNASWYDAAFYLNWLSERKGRQKVYTLTYKDSDKLGDNYHVVIDYDKNGFRLPNEAEWKFAARGGVNHSPYIYSGSDDPNEVAWYTDNSDNQTHPVGLKKPNVLGLYDMTGNVWEWCNDWYAMKYITSVTKNPRGANEGYSRLLRGGSWLQSAKYVRLVVGKDNNPRDRIYENGFRVLQDK